jgi:hypothetical protein
MVAAFRPRHASSDHGREARQFLIIYDIWFAAMKVRIDGWNCTEQASRRRTGAFLLARVVMIDINFEPS